MGKQIELNSSCPKISEDYISRHPRNVAIVLTVFSVIQLIKECIQFVQNPRGYISYENVLEVNLYVGTCLLVNDFTECNREIGMRELWQWQLGAVVLFLSWVNLLLFIRKTAFYGIYVILFIQVTKTFLKFSFVLLLFLCSFALTFHVLLENQISFKTVGDSLIKNFVMMLGDTDYESLLSLSLWQIFNSRIKDGVTHENLVPYTETTYLVFVVFLTMMNILLMNLMVGLAREKDEDMDSNQIRIENSITELKDRMDMLSRQNAVLLKCLEDLGASNQRTSTRLFND
ncbi:hypothetical protein Ciccas_000057 [Cichlidogyrus casuarinus]|uniref:Ion transport domain-containing protein n=1 Tax=Cichlidogyrus casuarinus TaxID=1844966 RepID=A0ABD2QP49_9PLAT